MIKKSERRKLTALFTHTLLLDWLWQYAENIDTLELLQYNKINDFSYYCNRLKE